MIQRATGMGGAWRRGRGARRAMGRRIAVPLLLSCGFVVHAHASRFDWAGITWESRTGHGAPCATSTWDERGAWVDARGALHLALRRLPTGRFACVEIRSVKRFGYGRYTFDVSGPIGAIDPNVVLGLFFYPTPDVGADGTNEIDIEVARWGHDAGPQLHYTAWYRNRKGSRSSRVRVPEDATDATFTLEWRDGEVDWTSPLHPGQRFHFRDDVADRPQTLDVNLWLFRQPAPGDGKDVEFVVNSLQVQ